MKKRLSKVSKELSVGMGDIVEFLRANGFETSEDPTEELSEEALETIKYNLSAYLFERRRRLKAKELPKASQTLEQIPVEIKIVEAASKEKKLIERIIGFTEFEWNYVVGEYRGKCSQPVKFTLFDEVLCELLLTEALSVERMGTILGLDLQKDSAEKEILYNAIHDLRKDKMVDGDESQLWLTDTGRNYATNGVKFSTFTRDFELYFDVVGGVVASAKDIFSKLKSEKGPRTISDLPLGIEDIRRIAEHQAPEIHFPEKGFQLQSVEFVKAENFKTKVWVVLLENFRDDTLRAIVYDEKQDRINEELSAALDQKDGIKLQLVDQLIKIDDTIELTEDVKSNDQIEFEKELIKKQSEIEVADSEEKIIQIKTEVDSIKKHFNSLEFEVELKRLFDTTTDTIWVISPWVREYAFRKRVTFFEQYLKKGGKIFVAYSEHEGHGGDAMVHPESMKKLLELEKNYVNFYFCELETFHYKNVWLKQDNGKNVYYSGSYNILSFFVSQGPKKIRQEKMTRMSWDSELEKQFTELLKTFGEKYINRAIEDFNILSHNPPDQIDRTFLQKLRTVDNSKLKPFVKQGIPQFDKAYEELESTKMNHLNIYRRAFFETKIEEFQQRAKAGTTSKEKKQMLESDFLRLRNEFMDFIDLQMKASLVKDSIDGLRVVNKDSRFRQRR